MGQFAIDLLVKYEELFIYKRTIFLDTLSLVLRCRERFMITNTSYLLLHIAESFQNNVWITLNRLLNQYLKPGPLKKDIVFTDLWKLAVSKSRTHFQSSCHIELFSLKCSCKFFSTFTEQIISLLIVVYLSPSEVNECSLFKGVCHQNCINTPRGYRCTCSKGYELNVNGISCSGEKS